MKLPTISKNELLDAIREGVRQAMWEMITNATQMPCHDFFDMVKDGVAEGIERCSSQSERNGQPRKEQPNHD